MADTTHTTRRDMMKGATLLGVATITHAVTVPALATATDPAVLAYDRHMRAEESYWSEYDRIHETYKSVAESDAAIIALDNSPIRYEGAAAIDAARTATATTLAGLACKAKIAAHAQGIDTDHPSTDDCEAVMLALIADIERMAGEAA